MLKSFSITYSLPWSGKNFEKKGTFYNAVAKDGYLEIEVFPVLTPQNKDIVFGLLQKYRETEDAILIPKEPLKQLLEMALNEILSETTTEYTNYIAPDDLKIENQSEENEEQKESLFIGDVETENKSEQNEAIDFIATDNLLAIEENNKKDDKELIAPKEGEKNNEEPITANKEPVINEEPVAFEKEKEGKQFEEKNTAEEPVLNLNNENFEIWGPQEQEKNTKKETAIAIEDNPVFSMGLEEQKSEEGLNLFNENQADNRVQVHSNAEGNKENKKPQDNEKRKENKEAINIFEEPEIPSFIDELIEKKNLNKENNSGRNRTAEELNKEEEGKKEKENKSEPKREVFKHRANYEKQRQTPKRNKKNGGLASIFGKLKDFLPF
jgi:hypothetical protein